MLLLMTFPVMLLTTVLILLETGRPVLYRQVRVGECGEPFEVLKFRSMRVNAESSGTPQWATQNDERATRGGRVIRLLRIDELPQIFNVLRGDMSFVGPRPERPYFVQELTRHIPFYANRHAVKPGITGWAQINYPYSASVEDAREKLQYDLYYAKNDSLFLDLMINPQLDRCMGYSYQPDHARTSHPSRGLRPDAWYAAAFPLHDSSPARPAAASADQSAWNTVAETGVSNLALGPGCSRSIPLPPRARRSGHRAPSHLGRFVLWQVACSEGSGRMRWQDGCALQGNQLAAACNTMRADLREPKSTMKGFRDRVWRLDVELADHPREALCRGNMEQIAIQQRGEAASPTKL